MFSYITSWQNNYHQSKALAAFMSWGRGDLTHNLYDGGAIYYIALASEQDIFITENGKCVAILYHLYSSQTGLDVPGSHN